MSRFSIRRDEDGWGFVTPQGKRTYLQGINHLETVFQGQTIEGSAGEIQRRCEEVQHHLRRWGFNCLGSGLAPRFVQRWFADWPYMAEVDVTTNSHWLTPGRFVYPDVFTPAFAQRVGEQVGKVCREVAGDPQCVGYYWTDTPQWDLDRAQATRGTDWVTAVRRLSAEAAGKQDYIQWLLQKYGSLDQLNRAYGTAFRERTDLLASPLFTLDRHRPQIRDDDLSYLGRIAAKLYQIIARAFDEHDRDALQLGERYKANDHPPEVLWAAARYADVLSVQPGPCCGPAPGPGCDELIFDTNYFRKLHEITGKPVLVSDHQVSFPSTDSPITLWHQMPTQAAAAKAEANFQTAAARLNFVVGYQRCQYMDRYDPARGLTKRGLVNEQLLPHETLVQQLQLAHDEVQTIRSRADGQQGCRIVGSTEDNRSE